MILRSFAWLSIAALTACGSDADNARPTTASLAPTAGASRVQPDDDKGRGSAPSTQVYAERGQAMGWLPADTLAVLRIPALRGEPSFDSTALWQALGDLDLGQMEGFLDGQWKAALARLREETPTVARVLDLAQGFEGEAVVALVKVFPTVFLAPGGDEVPVSLAAWLELGSQAEGTRQLLAQLAAEGAEGLRAVKADRYRMIDGPARVDLEVHGEWLGVHVGPKASVSDNLGQWRTLTPEKSFLVNEVVRAAPVAEGPKQRVYMEAFLNLEPVWAMAKAFAPPEVQAILGTTRVNHIHGISSVSAIDGAAFRDVVTLHAPAHDDVLSGMMDFPTLDPTWAHAIYRDAQSGGVAVFDLSQAWRSVRDHLPVAQRQGLDQSVKMVESMAGINLARDVFGNLGPHFAFASKGDLVSGANGGTFEASVVVQVANPEVLRSLVDRLLKDSGLMPMRRAFKVGSTTYYTLPTPAAEAPPWLEISYGFLDNALVLSTSPRTFEKTVLAMEDGGDSMPESFRPAFKDPKAGTGSITVQSCVAQVKSLYDLLVPVVDVMTQMPGPNGLPPAATGVGIPTWPELERALYMLPNSVGAFSRVPEGYRMESRTGLPSLWMAGAPAAVAASIAVPNLLQARTKANESAVEASLHGLVLAQHQFQATAAADRDGDGLGEFGFFGEMAGTTPLPSGRTIAPPVLSSTFKPSEQGRVEAYGYLFHVYLTGSVGEPVDLVDRTGKPSKVNADGAEKGFVIYAWPTEAGVTGTRAFVIDENGELFFSRNDQITPMYSGHDRAPRPDASFLRARSIVDRGSRSVRRGQDGVLWLKAD